MAVDDPSEEVSEVDSVVEALPSPDSQDVYFATLAYNPHALASVAARLALEGGGGGGGGVPSTRAITAGDGLTGGGTLAADRTIAVAVEGITDEMVDAANKDGNAATPSLRTLGTGTTQAVAGDDSRLSNARTPTAHAITHKTGGTDAIRLDELAAPTGPVGFNNQKITGLGAPTDANDAVTKAYADALASGLDVKLSVVATTTANITLSGEQTIDGIAVVAGDRVLVKDQTAAEDNGIYVASAGAWSRATDADTSGEVTSGLFTFVESGTVQADQGWVLATPDPITLDTTELTFTQFSGVGGTPTGVAGGALTGTYPNPTIATDAVTSTQILAGAVGASEIADASITDTEIATANKDGAAGTPSLRTLGTGSSQAAAGNDSRLSDSRTPTGGAGGVLSGTFPNPGFAVDMATQAELNALLPTVVLTSADVDVTGVSDATSTINSALASVNANRGGNVYLPNGIIYIAGGLTMNIQGQGLIGAEGMPGIGENVAKGTTQLVVGNGVWGVTIGSTAVTHFRGYRLENLQFYEKNAGQALGGLLMYRVSGSWFERVSAGRFTAGTAYRLDAVAGGGGGNAEYNTFVDCRCGKSLIGFHQLAANGTKWLGGYMDGSAGSLPVTATSRGFVLESGDSFRMFGTQVQGFDTLVEVGTNLGHEIYGIRCENWITQAIHVLGTGSGARWCKLFGSANNSVAGSIGSGVVIDAGASDIWDGMSVISTSTVATRHVDNGTRTRQLWHESPIQKAGFIGDSDFDDARDTMTGVDTTHKRLMVRLNGAWHSSDLTLKLSPPTLLKGTLTGSANQASLVVTLIKGALAGDMIVVCYGFGLGSTPTVTATDTPGNTYTVAVHADKTTSNTPHAGILYSVLTSNIAAGQSITLAYSTNVNYPIAFAYRVTGAAAVPVDQTVGATGVSVTAASGDITTTVADEIIFGAVCLGPPQTLTDAAGWTHLDNVSAGGNKALYTQYRIASSTGTFNAGGTFTSTDWAAAQASFKQV